MSSQFASLCVIAYEVAIRTHLVCVLSGSLCPTLCHPMDWSLLGSSVYKISQPRILEWVAISSSRGFSNPRAEPTSPASADGFSTP